MKKRYAIWAGAVYIGCLWADNIEKAAPTGTMQQISFFCTGELIACIWKGDTADIRIEEETTTTV